MLYRGLAIRGCHGVFLCQVCEGPDGRRVYDEIFEGLKVENGRIVGKTLYKYEIQENIYDEEGNIVKVIGKHCRKNSMSDALLSRLKYGGASNEMLEAFM